MDLEPGVSSDEVEAESEREPLKAQTPQDKSSSTPRRKHPGRQDLPSHLERIEQIVACTTEQCNCGNCGKQTTVIGDEETEVLDVRPAEYYVKVIRREKRAPRLRRAGSADGACARAHRGEVGSVRPGDHRGDGWQVLRVGELLIPISAAIKREVLAGTYIQADETRIHPGNHTVDIWGAEQRS